MSDFENEKENLLWGIQLSSRYHNHRRKFYDTLHTLSTFITVLLGSGTVVFALNGLKSTYVVIAGLLVTLFSTLDLVLSTTKKARHHYDLAKRFISLERKIIKKRDGDLDPFKDERLAIESDEPPTLKVLADYCYNEMLQSKGTERGNILKFKWYHRLTRDFFDFLPDKVKIDKNWQSHHNNPVESG